MKIFVSFFALGLLLSCHKPIKKDDSLKSFIISNSKADSGVLYLTKFDKIKWDKIYIIGAYLNKKNFDDRLKKYSSQILDTGIQLREGVTLFAVYNKDKLVNLTELDQNYYFVDAIILKKNTLGYYTKRDAVFNFKYYPNARWKSYKPAFKNNLN